MLTKVVPPVDAQHPSTQVFIDGQYEAVCQSNLRFDKGLSPGEYLLMYKAEFNKLHPCKRVTINLYADGDFDIKRISTDTYRDQLFEELEFFLS